MQQLILGGVRSGKSHYAQQLATDSGKQVIVIATATAGDEEMTERIRRHRAERPADWKVIEEPLALAEVLAANDRSETIFVIDCLTLWLTNLLLSPDSDRLQREQDRLFEILGSVTADVMFISNEVGMGIIAGDPLSRRFADETGRLHQQLASQCDRVILMVAGLAHPIKG